MKKVLNQITLSAEAGTKSFALLIDPDKTRGKLLIETTQLANDSGISYIFVGGSLINGNDFNECISVLKSECNLPIIIFPGNEMQISPEADAILFLSMISGRNPDLLIGKHVHAAPVIKEFGLEAIPTGYMLIDGGRITSAQYMSNTIPIPADKPDIAACTALAGEMLGLQLIYMDAGSGAENPVSAEMIEAVKRNTSLPIIVGGGISSAKQAQHSFAAGADIIVVGNAVEKNPKLIYEVTAMAAV